MRLNLVSYTITLGTYRTVSCGLGCRSIYKAKSLEGACYAFTYLPPLLLSYFLSYALGSFLSVTRFCPYSSADSLNSGAIGFKLSRSYDFCWLGGRWALMMPLMIEMLYFITT